MNTSGSASSREPTEGRLAKGLRLLALLVLVPLTFGFGLCGGLGLVIGFAAIGSEGGLTVAGLLMGSLGVVIAYGLFRVTRSLVKRWWNRDI